ncbi:hypothetical protein WJX74_005697 [Apatococcus lobatus]|uniref:Fungal lipase-type domain-containing protein n=1 Tax=Apatococcus lobatus TaxID=904363 RepID=A0AAW1RQ44_9CHLO
MRSASCLVGLFFLCRPSCCQLGGFLDNIGNSISNAIGGSSSAPSPAQTADAALGGTFVQLRNVNPYIAGPIWFKNADAAAYAYVAQNNMSLDGSLPNARRIPLASGCVAVISYDTSNETATIAFAGPSAVQDRAASTTSTNGLQQVGFLSLFIPAAQAIPEVLTIFESAIGAGNSSSLAEEIDDLSGGAVPMRVVCTGYGIGGSLADLCGVWAGRLYPDTKIRVMSFGAPFVGNDAYAYAHQQLVDLSYLWVLSSGASQVSTLLPHSVTNNSMGQSGSTAGTLVNYTSIILQRSFQTSNVPALSIEPTPTVIPNSSISDWFSIVDGLVAPSGSASSSTSAASYDDIVVPAIPINASDIREAFQFTDPTTPDPACPAVLCKMQGEAAAACGVYQNGNTSADTEFTAAIPGSVFVTGTSSGANVAVAYNSSTKIGLIAWRGSVGTRDWIDDAELVQVDFQWPGQTFTKTGLYNLADTFPGPPQVHTGFYDQLRDVTTDAKSDATNITKILNNMIGSDTPIRIVVTGHSLGAAVSSINAFSAAIDWPMADIHNVNLGSPLVGDQDWVNAFRGLVGRAYRGVNAHDQVPALPPLDQYRHVGYGVWIDDGVPKLQDRPYLDVQDTTWDNHTCSNYTGYLYNATQVYIPTFQLSVDNAVEL